MENELEGGALGGDYYPEDQEAEEEPEAEEGEGGLPTQRMDHRELHKLAFDNKDKDYRWVKVIGQGAFGVVFQAYNIKTLETVAIKKVYQDPKCRNREFTIVTSLAHPNVVKVYDYFFTKGEENEQDVYLNIVMDFHPTTLNKVLRYYHKMGKQFPPMLAKILTYQLLRSLAYIRGKGILHRDIKPQNVLLDNKNYRLLLCDFGSAKMYSTEEESVAYICSRFYRSPELILGSKTYSHEVDVWAAGCVVGEIILGEPLFCGNNNKEQFLRIVNIMGPPTESDLEAMGYQHRISMPKFSPVGLKRKMGPGVEPLLIDLMGKLLSYNPLTRIKPLQALTHPYFDDLRKNQILLNGRSITDLFAFTPEEVGQDQKLLAKLIPDWYKSN